MQAWMDEWMDGWMLVPLKVCMILLLQSTHHAGILLGQCLRLVTGNGLCNHMEERTISIRQHQHPFFTKIDLDPVNWFCTPFSILFAQDTHHLALVLPWARHPRSTHVVGWQVIHHL